MMSNFSPMGGVNSKLMVLTAVKEKGWGDKM